MSDEEMNPFRIDPTKNAWRRMKLYTAGPMSWIPQFNYPAFETAAASLRAEGFDVLSPMEMDSPALQAICRASTTGDPAELEVVESMGDTLSRDVKIILDEADGVVLLPGWEDSRGARIEAFIARMSGKPVFYNLTYDGRDLFEPGLHAKVCFCRSLEVYDETIFLVELDDAELDHVLTVADMDTLMKMERDKRMPQDVKEATDITFPTMTGKWVGDLDETDPGITWTEAEGDVDEPLPVGMFDSAKTAAAFGMFDSAKTAAAYGYEADGETRITDPDTGGQKGQKLARYDLIPARPLHLLAEHYGRGAEKYADRNWELGYDWSLNFAAAQRHSWSFWGGEDIDPETGSPHLIAAAWHFFALVEFMLTHPEKDDRP